MLLRRAALAAALSAGLCALAPPAAAFDIKVGREQLRLDLTESMFLSAHLDNDGNPKGDKTDENYGELINRLNAQLAWRRFLFAIRFDTGAWVHTPSAELLATQKYAEKRFLGPGVVQSRGPVPLGVTAFYLEKISASYIGRSIEVTLGDFYVNLGRGLVLSIRKIDELGVDTTVTGAKLIVHEGDFNAIAVAGVTNVQNIDQTRAQWIADPNDLLMAAHVDYRLFKKVLVGANLLFGRPACPTSVNCEKVKDIDFGYEYHLRPGLMLDAPRLTNWLGLYAEYVRQQDRNANKGGSEDVRNLGNAFYGAANLYLGFATLLVEAKYYDNYLPWHSSNDPFGNLVYMVPPTLERVIVPLNNNTDVLAGRGRFTMRLGKNATAYFSGQLARTHPSPVLSTTLVDLFAGAELRWNEGRSHVFPLVGYRNEHQEGNRAADVRPFTEEEIISVEWDAAQDLPKRFSLETQGLAWFRKKPNENPDGTIDPNRWVEGTAYLSVKWASKLVGTVGYEWTTIAKEQANTHHFINASVLWNITSATSVALFVGGNRPGLKCISGVCRDFPAFQGARLELVVRL